MICKTAKAPESGKWWRIVELNTNIPGARFLTLQNETYNIIRYRSDWRSAYARFWNADKGNMRLGQIGDSYGPWHEGNRPTDEYPYLAKCCGATISSEDDLCRCEAVED